MVYIFDDSIQVTVNLIAEGHLDLLTFTANPSVGRIGDLITFNLTGRNLGTDDTFRIYVYDNFAHILYEEIDIPLSSGENYSTAFQVNIPDEAATTGSWELIAESYHME